MRSTALAAALFFFATSAQADQLHVAVPGLTAVGLPASRAAFFTEALGNALARSGSRVTTAKAVQEMLGLERQRQLLGCGDTGSCAVELANALGADAIVSGEIAMLGESIHCNVKLLSARTGEVLEALSLRAASEEVLLDELETAAQTLAATAAKRLQRELKASKSGASVRALSAIPGGLGVAGIATGAILLGLARAQFDAIPAPGGGPPISTAEAQAHVDAGKPLETGGWVAISVGGAAVAAAVVMFIAGGSPPSVSASVMPLPSGGVVAGIGGAF